MKNRRNHYSGFNPSLIEDLFNLGLKEFAGVDQNFYRPSMNIIEASDKFRVELLAPGLKKSAFDIQLDGGRLTVAYKPEQIPADTKADKYLRKEFKVGAFTRTFNLPDTVNIDEISADYSKGILHLDLPKKEDVVNPIKRKVEIV